MKELFFEHKDDQDSPSLDTYSKVLSHLTNRFRRSFVIVDALNEHIVDEDDSDLQIELLSRLQQLQSKASIPCHIFITSRENPSIQSQLAGCAHIGIRAIDSDIRLFAKSRIFDNTKFRFAAELQSKAELAGSITEKLVKLAQGMLVSPIAFAHPLLRFLLPRLHLDRLGNQTTIRNLRNAFSQLPRKLDDVYDDAVIRIKGWVKEHKRLAVRTPYWISMALRSLRIDEHRHAVAVEPDDSNVDEESIPPVSLTTSVTAGLATVDAESGTIRFVHFTVSEYFKKGRYDSQMQKQKLRGPVLPTSHSTLSKPVSVQRMRRSSHD